MVQHSLITFTFGSWFAGVFELCAITPRGAVKLIRIRIGLLTMPIEFQVFKVALNAHEYQSKPIQLWLIINTKE